MTVLEPAASRIAALVTTSDFADPDLPELDLALELGMEDLDGSDLEDDELEDFFSDLAFSTSFSFFIASSLALFACSMSSAEGADFEPELDEDDVLISLVSDELEELEVLEEDDAVVGKFFSFSS